MAGGFVFVGKSRLRKLRRETRKTKKLEVKKKNPLGGSGEWSPQSQKFKYAPLLSARDDTDNISVCSTDSAISSGSDEDFLPLIDLRPQPTAFTMPFGPFKKSKELEEKKRKEEEAEKERQRLEEEERLRKEEEERIRLEEEERLRKEEEERLRKEEEDRLAEEQRLEEEKKKAEAEAEAKKKKGIFGIALFKSKFLKPKEETSEKDPLTAPVEEAKEPEVQTQSDVAKTQTTLEEEKVEELCEKNEDDTKSLDSGIESHKNGIDTDEQDGLKPQKVEKAKVAEEDRECTEMLCCTIM